MRRRVKCIIHRSYPKLACGSINNVVWSWVKNKCLKDIIRGEMFDWNYWGFSVWSKLYLETIRDKTGLKNNEREKRIKDRNSNPKIKVFKERSKKEKTKKENRIFLKPEWHCCPYWSCWGPWSHTPGFSRFLICSEIEINFFFSKIVICKIYVTERSRSC